MTDKLPNYGGQAVIEGVMMRGARAVAIAMRDPEDNIVLHTEPLGGIYKTNIVKIPFLRGLILLWDSMGLGMRALTISANTQGEEEEQLEGWALYLTLGISLVFSIGLFFVLPATGSHLIETWLGVDNNWVANLIEGGIRLSILIGYIWGVGKISDIKRVFMYHGAEHKTINAFEAGEELTPENVAKYSLEHPRCGTGFLLTVMLISILFFSLLGPMPNIWIRLALRISMVPVLASLSYEYIRWTANNLKSPIVRFMIRPNMAMQRLTTIEPDLGMLEVSIASFNAMKEKELEYLVP
ncbi:MAG: DUF1385 domain-containing protein [Chloroflexi bacterium]|jgi:uncharacterized protein YqhQ|nr:DUF1385 domain-containing protein [Chloroflexota bacterium]MBT3670741.1 DUF1385 domain-containing protein [Chloroflexota bacterium]MBT4003869.1 DUF1385 domain-containing protein [Chloroflexota bacterium]MBT4305109.1 DUF1385 domain-containing protein [Chloroflexota bacterium]MBT4533369.1 DUF1385 domain-containing protein [Chloroflexota bacterium]